MRRVHFGAAALALAALCAGAPGAAYGQEKTSRTRVTANGQYSIRMVETGPSQCRVEVLKESKPHWTLERCVGTVDDLYFLSDDAERFWVVLTLPQKTFRRPKKKKGYPAWTYATVATLYDRDGKAVRHKRLNELVRTRSGLDDLRQLKKRFKWLEGVAGEPGVPPRLSDEGKIELTGLDRRVYTLEF